MEWTIQDLGAVGEFLGSIAVLVTLIYVAIQVREARREGASTALQQRSNQVLSVYGGATTSDSLAEALELAYSHYDDRGLGALAIKQFLQDEAGLEPKQALQVGLYYGLIWNIYVTNHVVSDPSQRVFNDSVIVAHLRSALGRRTWGAMREVAMGEFAQHVDDLIQKHGLSDTN